MIPSENRFAPFQIMRMAETAQALAGLAIVGDVSMVDVAASIFPGPEPPMPTVTCDVTDHLAHVRLSRPENGNRFSTEMFRALAGLVYRDLASGRRTIGDTMTVLKQLRAFIKVTPALNDRLKTLGVDVAMTTPGSPERADAEARVRDWLAQHERDPLPFLEP